MDLDNNGSQGIPLPIDESSSLDKSQQLAVSVNGPNRQATSAGGAVPTQALSNNYPQNNTASNLDQTADSSQKNTKIAKFVYLLAMIGFASTILLTFASKIVGQTNGAGFMTDKTPSTLLLFSYIAILFGYFGFAYMGIKFKKMFLIISAGLIAAAFVSLIMYLILFLFGNYTNFSVGLNDVPSYLVYFGYIGALASAVSFIIFGIALLELKDRLGKIALVAGILTILGGVATLGGLLYLSYVAYVVFIIILYKELKSPSVANIDR